MFVLYILFIYTLCASYFPTIAFQISGSGVWFSDVLLMISFFFIIVLQPLKVINFHFKKYILRRLIFYLLLILIVPIIIGMLNGHNMVSVFRDARSIFLCITPLLFIFELDSYNKWLRFVKFVRIGLIIILLILLASITLKINFSYHGNEVRYTTEYGTIFQYGLPDATSYYPIILFVLLTSIIKNTYPLNMKNKYLIYLSLVLSFLGVFLTGSRGYFIAIICGVIYNIYLLRNSFRRNTFILIIFSLSSFLIFHFLTGNVLSNSAIIQRYATVLELDDHNVKLRTSALDQAHSLIDNKFIGTGYGGINQSGDYRGFSVYNLTHLLALNSYAWLIYRIGYIGLLAFLFIYGIFILNIKDLSKKCNSQEEILLIATQAYFFSTLIMSSSGNLFFRGASGTIALSVIIGLVLSLENILYTNNNIQDIQ